MLGFLWALTSNSGLHACTDSIWPTKLSLQACFQPFFPEGYIDEGKKHVQDNLGFWKRSYSLLCPSLLNIFGIFQMLASKQINQLRKHMDIWVSWYPKYVCIRVEVSWEICYYFLLITCWYSGGGGNETEQSLSHTHSTLSYCLTCNTVLSPKPSLCTLIITQWHGNHQVQSLPFAHDSWKQKVPDRGPTELRPQEEPRSSHPFAKIHTQSYSIDFPSPFLPPPHPLSLASNNNNYWQMFSEHVPCARKIHTVP